MTFEKLAKDNKEFLVDKVKQMISDQKSSEEIVEVVLAILRQNLSINLKLV